MAAPSAVRSAGATAQRKPSGCVLPALRVNPGVTSDPRQHPCAQWPGQAADGPSAWPCTLVGDPEAAPGFIHPDPDPAVAAPWGVNPKREWKAISLCLTLPFTYTNKPLKKKKTGRETWARPQPAGVLGGAGAHAAGALEAEGQAARRPAPPGWAAGAATWPRQAQPSGLRPQAGTEISAIRCPVSHTSSCSWGLQAPHLSHPNSPQFCFQLGQDGLALDSNPGRRQAGRG